MYTLFLVTPSVSDGYRKNAHTSKEFRILAATTFLSSKEYDVHGVQTLATFDLIENILKSKVLTYAIAFAGGAANGGTLYQEARRDLLTWRAIFDGATFVNGVLV